MLLASVSVVSENYLSTLTTPFYLTDFLPYDDHNTLFVMRIDVPVRGRVHRGYCSWRHAHKDATQLQDSLAPHALIRTQNFIIIFMVFPG